MTLVDVVEHVGDPVALLRACRGHGSGGHLLVVTPDAASVAARWLGRRWWHLRLAHVGYFTRPTLTDALARAGLVAERWWRPGWVFEVGYLVERVGSYAPPAALGRPPHGKTSGPRRTVPLNLYDSLAVIVRARRQARGTTDRDPRAHPGHRVADVPRRTGAAPGPRTRRRVPGGHPGRRGGPVPGRRDHRRDVEDRRPRGRSERGRSGSWTRGSS